VNQAVSLPTSRRFFEIRFESIGGLGAHTAAQVLASAAVLRMGLNGAQFSSDGSEKKGSLVRSYVRLGPADWPIRTSTPVDMPDAIVVFHAALLRNPATFGGLCRDGTFIYNAPKSKASAPEELEALPSTARVIRVDALGIATKETSRPNAVLLGALCGAFPFLDREQVLAALSEASVHPEAVAANERAFRRGASEFEELEGVGRGDGDLPPAGAEPLWGYETQPIGGIIPEPGNTVWNDLSASRNGLLPVFKRENCIHCGLCYLVCPDYCLVWEDGEKGGRFERELMGVDYRYCKGCMRCVETCPASAMSKKAETPGLADRLGVPLFPDVVG
jgi:pyruvate ferredoxin oxidoreductase gamma subunit